MTEEQEKILRRLKAINQNLLETLKKELLEQGVTMVKDPETDLITLPEAAKLLGEDAYRLSQLAYEKRITTERYGGGKHLVRLARLKKELKRLPPKKSYPAASQRLTPAQRQEVARLYATGNYTHKQLADQFRVSQNTIRNCINKIS